MRHGVTPRLRREVTSEAEHPVPAMQLLVGSFGIDDSRQLANGRFDALDVITGGARRLEVFGRFGGVLRDVGGHSAVGQCTVKTLATHDRPHVELLAPGERASHGIVRKWSCSDARLPHSGLDRGHQMIGRHCGRRRGEGEFRMDTVEPDDGVEVDDSPTLELGDLRELQPYDVGRCALRHAERSSQLPAQPNREPTPQLGRVVLPDDVTDVVVALGAHRVTPPRIVVVVVAAASSRFAVLADAGATVDGGRVNGSERRGCEREENHRVLGDLLWHLLHPTRSAGHDHVPGVALVLVTAGLAACGASIAAPSEGDAVRFARRRVLREDLAGCLVERRRGSDETHRVEAVARRGDVVHPTIALLAAESPRNGLIETHRSPPSRAPRSRSGRSGP